MNDQTYMERVESLKAGLESASLRKISAMTGIGKNRLHTLRHHPGNATIREMSLLARWGYIRLKLFC